MAALEFDRHSQITMGFNLAILPAFDRLPNNANNVLVLGHAVGSDGLLCMLHDIPPPASTLIVTSQMRSKRARRRIAEAGVDPNLHFSKPAIAGRLLAILNSQGQGTIYQSDGKIQLHYNRMGGVQFSNNTGPRDAGTRRQWNWSGEPHIHGPPFQPIVIRLNAHMTVRIVDRSRIHVHFQYGKHQCRINVSMSDAQAAGIASPRVIIRNLRGLERG
ncbi:unnamed protein product [Echinostoma caproni]|uniref:FAM194 domain-containing protein n=1 Tax=Echinostoma caproni TaxID=27848 RepID=A0A183ABT9_9TREM|nr:unnamed protein product [Echinostoma caproni]